ncbi:hypothetical protein EH240_09185 [Mesorhizobium tamadayense]|uniref:Uncharacterized protein n=1 Tax=Mesorhizobium tamadayense TaxID=425306 RepID=A0A3P3FZ26_9HYPH|nr:hypothetical protein EH240_09185 [Mesorhizobium tamadayense]
MQAYTRDFVANALWLEINAADPALPPHAGSTNDFLMRWIKKSIGHVAERSTATLDDLNCAQELKARTAK